MSEGCNLFCLACVCEMDGRAEGIMGVGYGGGVWDDVGVK